VCSRKGGTPPLFFSPIPFVPLGEGAVRLALVKVPLFRRTMRPSDPCSQDIPPLSRWCLPLVLVTVLFVPVAVVRPLPRKRLSSCTLVKLTSQRFPPSFTHRVTLSFSPLWVFIFCCPLFFSPNIFLVLPTCRFAFSGPNLVADFFLASAVLHLALRP